MKKKFDISREDIKNMITDYSSESVDDKLVDMTEDALINFAATYAVPPPADLKGKILQRLKYLSGKAQEQQVLNINALPLLDENANWLEWQQVIEGITPPDEYEDIYLHTLESNENRELFVAWVKEFVPEEVHHDLIESFLILEGTCECHISNEKGETRIVRLGQGDYIAMALGETHDIVITSACPAKAILQWRKVAA